MRCQLVGSDILTGLHVFDKTEVENVSGCRCRCFLRLLSLVQLIEKQANVLGLLGRNIDVDLLANEILYRFRCVSHIVIFVVKLLILYLTYEFVCGFNVAFLDEYLLLGGLVALAEVMAEFGVSRFALLFSHLFCPLFLI